MSLFRDFCPRHVQLNKMFALLQCVALSELTCELLGGRWVLITALVHSYVGTQMKKNEMSCATQRRNQKSLNSWQNKRVKTNLEVLTWLSCCFSISKQNHKLLAKNCGIHAVTWTATCAWWLEALLPVTGRVASEQALLNWYSNGGFKSLDQKDYSLHVQLNLVVNKITASLRFGHWNIQSTCVYHWVFSRCMYCSVSE